MNRRVLGMFAAVVLSAGVAVGVGPAATAAPPADDGGSAYIALGDSVAAGTGNLPYADVGCLRSARAYPDLLAAQLGGGVTSEACAGWTSAMVAAGQLGDLGPDTTLVTLTAGINDIGWIGLIQTCATGTPVECDAAIAATLSAIPAVPGNIAALVGQIRLHAPSAKIVVTGYARIFGDVTGSCSIGALDGTQMRVTGQQAYLANLAVGGVNAAVAGGVSAYVGATGDPGVEFVPVDDAFAGHRLCDTSDRWISGLVSGKKNADRGLHPNAAGQQAYAAVIAAALAS